MHGIEIDDVTVHVAKTALWIAGQALPHLPFHDSGNTIRVNPCATAEIRCCQPNNALRNGRPHYVGHQWRMPEQQADMDTVFSGYEKGMASWITYARGLPKPSNTPTSCPSNQVV